MALVVKKKKVNAFDKAGKMINFIKSYNGLLLLCVTKWEEYSVFFAAFRSTMVVLGKILYK